MHRVRSADRLFAGLGQTEKSNFPLADQLGHSPDNVFNRNSGIDAVLIEKIDVVSLQTAQRGLQHFADMVWPAVEPRDLSLVVELEPELGGDNNPVARDLPGF